MQNGLQRQISLRSGEMNRIREWISIKIVKAPGLIVLLGIFIANAAIIGISAFIISLMAPASMEDTGFWSYVFHTITLVLGVGGVENLIEDIGQANIIYVISCVISIIIGLIVFTGAIIGYMSDFISSFIENADSSSRKLHISDHIVILNWNTLAAEIINELLHKNTKEKVVVLVENNRDDVIQDIDERLSDTIEAKNDAVLEAAAHMSFFERRRYIRKYGITNKLTIIVREGDSSSTKQLNDISIKLAKSVIILSNDITGDSDGFDYQDRLDWREKGNADTIKTLIQVAHMTGTEDSADDQQVVVEVEDDWTLALVNTIIEHKMRKGKCNITPVPVNRILGLIFSQFSIMPELNIVYSTLFSNKDAAFYVQSTSESSLSETEFITAYLNDHLRSIPLTVTGGEGVTHHYFMAGDEKHIHDSEPARWDHDFRVSLNPDFEINDKHVILLGHNSNSAAIMEGFDSFSGEWKKKDGTEALNVIVVDSEQNLARQDHYKQYSCVKKVIAADIFEKDLICSVIGEFIGGNNGDRCIMILSDDTLSAEEIDASALTYLILVQDIIGRRVENDPDFDLNSIDMVVEILNPKNYDIVNNYSTNNIVISNRYISKIIMQVGEKEALFDFYTDILTYDDPDSEGPDSKEVYIKKAAEFFSSLPGACTAADLIRAVYHSSPDDNKSVVLGYFRPDGEMILFEGDQSDIHVTLSGEDKLIIFR
jgi:hypothetical protein